MGRRGYWLLPGQSIPKMKAFEGDCDDMRRRLAKALAGGMTEAELLRRLAAAVGRDKPVAGNSYAAFMAFKGPDAGDENIVYRAARAYFMESDGADSNSKVEVGANFKSDVEVGTAAGAGTAGDENKANAGGLCAGAQPAGGKKRKPTAAAAAEKKADKAEAAANFASLCKRLEALTEEQLEANAPAKEAMNCAAVRRRINEFIPMAGITQGALMAHVGVGSGPFARFMAHTGPWGGDESCVYMDMRHFFERIDVLKKVERRGGAKKARTT